MAYLDKGQAGQAVALLKRAVTLNGEYDHVVTPLILQELGQLAIESGDYPAATKYLEEASYSAMRSAT